MVVMIRPDHAAYRDHWHDRAISGLLSMVRIDHRLKIPISIISHTQNNGRWPCSAVLTQNDQHSRENSRLSSGWLNMINRNEPDQRIPKTTDVDHVQHSWHRMFDIPARILDFHQTRLYQPQIWLVWRTWRTWSGLIISNLIFAKFVMQSCRSSTKPFRKRALCVIATAFHNTGQWNDPSKVCQWTISRHR
jgi:hypothetical protein